MNTSPKTNCKMTLVANRSPLDLSVTPLEPYRLAGQEGVSQLFEFQIELAGPRDQRVSPNDLLGRGLSILIERDGLEPRYISGIVSRFSVGKRDANYRYYTAVLVPELWRATRRTNCRVFQRKSVPEIIQSVIGDIYARLPSDGEGSLPRVRFSLSNQYERLDYCVQYEESDFEFISRLAEEEGLFFCFEHSAEGEALVFCDRSYTRPSVRENVPFPLEEDAGMARMQACVSSWESSQEIRSGHIETWDHWYKHPERRLVASHRISGHHDKELDTIWDLRAGGAESLKVYRGGQTAQQFDYSESDASEADRVERRRDRLARLELERESAQAVISEGESDISVLVPGKVFNLSGHPEEEGPHFILTVEHEMEQMLTLSTNRTVNSYSNRFTCMPSHPTLVYRPMRKTARPRIQGTQTATVVGPKGDSIHVDAMGRIKVCFHWDARTPEHGSNSCWVRVSQIWAGQGWGAFFWPRVGHEVIVGFEEGNPDRPIVLGSVYNGKNMPPMPLPAERTSCGIHSCTVGGNPRTQFNALVFHDMPGDEHLQVHSETYECITSETSKYSYCDGPRIDVITPSLPLVGGGGGGGWGALGGAVFKGGTSIGKSMLKGLIKKGFPATDSKFTGSSFGSVVFGDKTSHLLQGADISLHFDYTGMLSNTVGGAVKKKLGADVAKSFGKGKEVAEWLLAFGFAMKDMIEEGDEFDKQSKEQFGDYPKGGDRNAADMNNLMFFLDKLVKGPIYDVFKAGGKTLLAAGVSKSDFAYLGSNQAISRGYSESKYSTKKFWTDPSPPSLWAKVMVPLIGTVGMLHDLLSSNTLMAEKDRYLTPPEKKKENANAAASGSEKKEEKGNVRNVWGWIETFSDDLAEVLTGVLQKTEGAFLGTDEAKRDANAALNQVKTDLETARLNLQQQVTTLDTLRTGQNQSVEGLERSVTRLTELVAGVSLTSQGNSRERVEGIYTVNAVSTEIKSTAHPVLEAGKIAYVSLNAQSGLPEAPTGFIDIAGNQNISMRCGGSVLMNMQNDGVTGQMVMTNSLPGRVTLKQGDTPLAPRLMLTNNPVDQLPKVEISNATNTLTMEALQTKMECGATTMTLDPTKVDVHSPQVILKGASIKLQDETGSASVEIGPDGVKINGIRLSLRADTEIAHQALSHAVS